MVRTRKSMQFTLEPGHSRELGTFVDGDGNRVTLVAAVYPCGGRSPRTLSTTKSADSWKVRLPPDVSFEVDGLVDDKGTALRITVIAHGCPGDGGPNEDEPGDWPFGTDVEAAEISADVVGER